MMNRSLQIGTLIIVLSGFLALASWGSLVPEGTIDWDTLDETKIVPGELLVGFKSDGAKKGSLGAMARMTAHEAVGTSLKQSFKLVPWDHVKLTSKASLKEIAEAYLADPNVAYVEPNYRVYAVDTVPNDPSYGDLWGMERINAPQAWDLSTGSTNIVVAVIDTGVNMTHEDLASHIWSNPGESGPDGFGGDKATNGQDDDGNGYVDDVHGWDFVNNDNDPADGNGHGTHCSGTIGGVGNNSVGVAGVCWTVKIVGLKFLGDSGGGSTAGGIAAVEYATGLSQYIKLTSNSWGGGGESEALRAAINASGQAGQLFVAAAGNSATDNDSIPHYPSSYDCSNIIAVASIAEGGAMSSFSCYGATSVDLAAPGSEILSCWMGGNSAYNTISGTSMATPHVSGAAALLWAINPGATWMDVASAILDNTATNANLVGLMVTEGELDLFAAAKTMGATLKLDQLAYKSDATVGVDVSDSDAGTNYSTVSIHWLTTNNATGLRAEDDVLLPEEDPGTGFKYAGSFTLTSGVSNDAIHGDTLTVSYIPLVHDALSVSVPIDDVPPVIFGIEAADFAESSFTVRWNTDEPADSHVLVSETMPLTGAPEYGSDSYVETYNVSGGVTQYHHVVSVTGLTEKTLYYVAVKSGDYAGNIATNPADLGSTDADDYLQAITRYRRVQETVDFENGDDGWTHDGVGDSWEYGLPTYGPPDSPFGSKCWGTDLDGRYANDANLWLKTRAFELGYQSKIKFSTWFNIEYFYDKGFVELNDGTGWHNVTSNTDVFAGSPWLGSETPDWMDFTIDLSDYDNETVWLRFRLDTDYSVIYAGWYIDDVELSDVPPDGVWPERIVVDDSIGGDGDGYAEPGESFDLSVYVAHYDGGVIYTQTVMTLECPTEGVNTEFSSETINYGDLSALVSIFGDHTPEVTVDSDVSSDTTASFLYSISSTSISNSGPWEGSFDITVGVRETLTGIVTNIVGGSTISNAIITGSASGYPDVSTISEADGSYELNGLVSGVAYQITACKTNEFSPSDPVAVTAPNALNIGLGKAYGTPDPDSFFLFVNEGETNLVTAEMVFDNSAGTVDLVYEAEIEYEDFFTSEDGWLGLSSMTGTVAAGSIQTNTLLVDPSGLDSFYIADILLEGNDIGCADIEIPVWLFIQSAPILELLRVEVSGGDDDPYIEPGETNTLNLVLRNLGSAGATTPAGTLSTTSAVTIVSDAAGWPTLVASPDPASIQSSSTDPTIAVGTSPDGTVYPLSLEVTSPGGTWSFNFSVTTLVRQAVSGHVYDGAVGVEGVEVKAHGPAGVESTTETDASGAYTLYGLTNAVYDIAVIPPPAYNSPGAEEVTVSGSDISGVDFDLLLWSLSLSPDSFSKVVYEGEDTTDTIEASKGAPDSGYIEYKIENTGAIPPPVPDQAAPEIDWEALTDEDCAPGQMFVMFKESVGMQAQVSILAEQNLTVAQRYGLTDAILVDLPPKASLSEMAGILSADASVEYVEPNYIYKPFFLPNDPLFDELYGMHNERQTGGTLDSDMDAVEAWDITTGETNIIIAVIDTGVELRHEDLLGQCVLGFDFGVLTTEEIVTNADGIVTTFTNTLLTPPIFPGTMTVYATNVNDGEVMVLVDDGANNLVSTNGLIPPHGTINYDTGEWTLDFEDLATAPTGVIYAAFTDSDPTPDYYEGEAEGVDHGTHVAGTVAAAGNNSTGVIGVAWNTRIMPLKASTNIPTLVGYVPVFFQDALLNSLDYAVTNGARVSNHSYGGPSFSPIMRNAFSNAMAYGHIAVCAAGNSGANVDDAAFTMYPAGYNLPNIVSVAAVDHNDDIAYFSNYGDENVDVAAPGVDIMSCWPYWDVSTTSVVLNAYETKKGTSMASPHVAGLLGLLASYAPSTSWDILVQALLDGARYDENLTDYVRYAGHANVLGALNLLNPYWLSVDPDYATIPADGTATNFVTFNLGKHLSAGTYNADIVVINGSHSTNVPVELTVMAAPRPVVDSVTVVGGDGDGVAEPNETVQLNISLHNNGSAFVLSPTGFLSTAEATVTSGQAEWNSIQIDDSEDATVLPEVQFGAVVSSSVSFDLTIGDNPASGRGPWDLAFELDVAAANSLSGTVENTDGTMLAGVMIEYWGAASGTNITDGSGYYRINGLPTNGLVKVRPVAADYEKPVHQECDLSAGDVEANFILAQPDITFSTGIVEVAVQRHLSAVSSISITNASSDAFTFECVEMPRCKVALISDGEQLVSVSNVFASMGCDVSVYTSNYELVYVPNPLSPGNWSAVPTTYYSSDDALVFSYDLVVADLSGLYGAGRLFSEAEEDVFERYLDRGGKLIVTGANPLSSPDSSDLMGIVGATTLNQLSSVEDTALMTNELSSEQFIDIDSGDQLETADVLYDLATPAQFGGVTPYFTADEAMKLMSRDVVTASATGTVYYWAGNHLAGDWKERGAWQDVLKNILIDELAEDVSWVSVSTVTNTLSESETVVEITFNENGNLDVGTNYATVLVLGNYPGADEQYVNLILDVAPITIQTLSSTGVTNWMGNYIAGDGTETSALFQVIWAGSDGSIDGPSSAGSTTGDDVLLAVYSSGKQYGRFGHGYEEDPDQGLFDDIFGHSLHPTNNSRKIYVRAWDASTIASSVAYGESLRYAVTNKAYESHDFGTWSVTTVPNYPGGGKDSNGDSILDGWYVLNGLDARTPVEGLVSVGTYISEFGTHGSGNGEFNWPSRVFLTDKFVYVLDTGNNRIQVWNRANETFGFAYTPVSPLSQPYGMAKDPRSGVNRFAVADTANNQIRVFSFDPSTGAIAELFSFGSQGSGDGQFQNPHGVAFDLFGYIYVADTDNDRIQVFNASGVFARKFGAFGSADRKFDAPQGLCVSAGGTVYVADTANDRIQLMNGGTGDFMWKFGVYGTNSVQFEGPTDVQIGIFDRIFVMDRNNHRAQVLMQNGGSFDHLLTFGVLGAGDGELNFPFGITPVSTSSVVYVADTFNHRVEVFDTVIDADADGMDDEWEENNSIDDPYGDADGDGVSNIGEYRIQTDPNQANTDGDEWSDGQEISGGTDPLDPLYELLRMTGIMPPDDVILSYMTESGEVYRLQSINSLLAGDWTNIPDSTVTSTADGMLEFTNAVSPDRIMKFYRAVRIEE